MIFKNDDLYSRTVLQTLNEIFKKKRKEKKNDVQTRDSVEYVNIFSYKQNINHDFRCFFFFIEEKNGESKIKSKGFLFVIFVELIMWPRFIKMNERLILTTTINLLAMKWGNLCLFFWLFFSFSLFLFAT